MNLKTIDRIKKILESIYNHWVFFPFVMGMVMFNHMMVGTFPQPEYWGWIICSIFPFCGRLLIDGIRRKWLCIICLVGLVIADMFAVSYASPVYGVYFIALIIYFIAYLYMKVYRNRYTVKGMFSPVLLLASTVIVMSLVHFKHIREFDSLFVIFCVILLIAYFLIYFLEHYVTVLVVNEGTAGQVPGREIFQSGMQMVMVYLVVGIPMILVLTGSSIWKKLFQGNWYVLQAMLRKLFAYLFPPVAEDVIEEEMLQNTQLDQLFEAEDPSLLAQVLNVVLWVAAYALLAFLAYKLLQKLYELMKSRRVRTEKITTVFTEPDFRERIQGTHSGETKRKSWREALSPTERIRRLYRKKVKDDPMFVSGFTGLGKHEVHTPKRPEKITAREYGVLKERPEIAEIYEKARYSGVECDGNDLKRMKQACK